MTNPADPTTPSTPSSTRPAPAGSRVVRLAERSKRELSPAHREHLHASGLTDETIALAELYTERHPATIAALLDWKAWKNGDALVFPFFLPGPNQTEAFMCRVRPSKPRLTPKGKPVKYEQPKGIAVAPYFPPRARRDGGFEDLERPVAWVEGEKKALLLDQLGFAAVGGTGVSCFHDADLKADAGIWRLSAVIRESVKVAGKKHLIVFDSDAAENDDVMLAARRLGGMLLAGGAASVAFIKIPHAEDGSKLGIDDYFVAFGEAATRALLENGAIDIDPLPVEEPFQPLKGPRALRDAPIDAALRMPEGYVIAANGTVFARPKRDDGKEGKEDFVSARPLLIRRVLVDYRTARENLELTFPREGSWRTISVERAIACSARRIVDELAAVGAPVDSGNAGDIVTWLRNLESVNERRLPRVLCSTRCGWHDIDGERAFVIGADVVGTERALTFNDSSHHGRLQTALAPKGAAEPHLEALREAFAADRIAATAICAALAAPLLSVIGAPGFAVHLAGDSSRGKSSMMKIAASLYGDPRSSDWIAKWDSTHVGLEQRAAALCDLPLCLDESSLIDREQAQQAVYMLIDGTGRTRGARAGGLRETASWRTVVISTGERGLVDEQTHTGAQVRVLQLEVAGFGALDAGGVDRLVRACGENHGEVGRRWLRAIAETDPARLRAVYRTLANKALATMESGSRNIDARRVDFLATLGLAEALAARHLGFGNESGATMLSWLDRRFDAQRRSVETLSVRALDVVRELWSSQRKAFGTVQLGDPMFDEADSLKSGWGPVTIGYRHEEFLHCIPGPLKEALEKRGIDGATAFREWAREGVTRSNELGRGTNKVRIGQSRARYVTFPIEVINGTDQANAPGLEQVQA